MLKIGVIGGSGLDKADVLEAASGQDAPRRTGDIEVNTPYGPPSSPLRVVYIAGREVYLVARHGREHTIPPTQVNYRANIWALKEQGCKYILATTAVGSLRRRIERGHLVILDQFIDFTKGRPSTFFEEFAPGDLKHTPMADPFDAGLRARLVETCRKLELPHHERGTVVTIEGPRFSTRAESHMFRGFGADVINMSIATEAILANEAQVPYAAVAMSTDYDCWKEDEAPVTWEEILRIFDQNSQRVTRLLQETIAGLE